MRSTPQTLDMTASNFKVTPVRLNGQLGVQVQIPLIDSTKTATLFSIVKYPVFHENQKFQSNCPTNHLAIHDNSLTYTILTCDEYLTCSSGKR
jgi:hypothetical protein